MTLIAIDSHMSLYCCCLSVTHSFAPLWVTEIYFPDGYSCLLCISFKPTIMLLRSDRSRRCPVWITLCVILELYVSILTPRYSLLLLLHCYLGLEPERHEQRTWFHNQHQTASKQQRCARRFRTYQTNPTALLCTFKAGTSSPSPE